MLEIIPLTFSFPVQINTRQTHFALPIQQLQWLGLEEKEFLRNYNFLFSSKGLLIYFTFDKKLKHYLGVLINLS